MHGPGSTSTSPRNNIVQTNRCVSTVFAQKWGQVTWIFGEQNLGEEALLAKFEGQAAKMAELWDLDRGHL